MNSISNLPNPDLTIPFFQDCNLKIWIGEEQEIVVELDHNLSRYKYTNLETFKEFVYKLKEFVDARSS